MVFDWTLCLASIPFLLAIRLTDCKPPSVSMADDCLSKGASTGYLIYQRDQAFRGAWVVNCLGVLEELSQLSFLIALSESGGRYDFSSCLRSSKSRSSSLISDDARFRFF